MSFEERKGDQIEDDYDMEDSGSMSGDDCNEMGDAIHNQGRGGARDHKSKTKRRSKNDNSGRDFICGC